MSAIDRSPRDIPIIFSRPMVRALLDGRKTVTRRLAWRDAEFGLQDYASEQLEDMDVRGWNAVPVADGGPYQVYKPTSWQKVKPGDRLWVRENHSVVPASAYRNSEGVQQTVCPTDPDMAAIYACGWDRSIPKWKPSIHMPRWASRLTLVVTGVKIERLQEISRDDAIAEGLEKLQATGRYVVTKGDQYFGLAHRDPRLVYCSIWCALHGEASWEKNPEVVAITFDVWNFNIDKMPKEMTEAELLAGLDDLLAVPR